ncbi:MAG: hypothetical protein IKZ38_03685 [Clostridia bacterium]|nr:hypothetical protein [Clostridia bacterium]
MERNSTLKYGKTAWEKGYFLYATLFCAIALTVLVFCTQSSLFERIAQTENWKVFILSCTGVYILIGLIHTVYSEKNNLMNMADAVIMSVIPTCALYLAYRIFIFKSFSLPWIITLSVLLILATLILVVKWYNYDKFTDNEDAEIVYKPSRINYFKALFAKFPLFSILILSAVELCAFMAFVCPTLQEYFGLFKLNQNLVSIIICLVLPFVYVVAKTNDKHTVALDAILFSSFISLPLLFFYIFLTHGLNEMMIAWTVAFALVILFTIMRFMCFDVSLGATDYDVLSKNRFISYLKNTEHNHGVFSSLALGSVLALCFSHVFSPRHLYMISVFLLKNGMLAHPAFFVVIVLFLAVYLTLPILGLFAVVGIPAKKVHFGDFSVITLISFSALSLICVIDSFSVTRTIISSLCLLISLSVLVARINRVYPKN